MTGFLLDTDVLSMFSPSRRPPLSPVLGEWRNRQLETNMLYLSAMSVHEIQKGVHLLISKGATRQASALQTWLIGLVTGFGDRILPMDAEVACISGQLEALAISRGSSPGVADAIIAGTAKAHDLTVITNKLRHFQLFGISVKSPEQVTP